MGGSGVPRLNPRDRGGGPGYLWKTPDRCVCPSGEGCAHKAAGERKGGSCEERSFRGGWLGKGWLWPLARPTYAIRSQLLQRSLSKPVAAPARRRWGGWEEARGEGRCRQSCCCRVWLANNKRNQAGIRVGGGLSPCVAAACAAPKYMGNIPRNMPADRR